jgi:predicted ATP-grasp superfamily ATP-dependent carboligase
VLSRFYRFLLPSDQLVEDVTCKLRFAKLAQDLDLPAPRSIVPDAKMSTEEIVARVGLPCVLKPYSHIGRYRLEVQHEHGHAYKVLRADTVEDLRAQREKMATYCERFVAQEYIPGDDGLLYSLHVYFGQDGNPLGLFAGRKIRTCPKDSGYSAYLELVHEPQLISTGLRVLRKMHHLGPAKLDFKRHPTTGQYYLLECNTRFTLWNYLGAACDMNLPLMALNELYDRPVKMKMRYRTDVRWLSFGNDFRAFLREYRPDGDWTWLNWLWSLRGRKIYDVFAWRDPLPWMICCARYLAANWGKLSRRLRPQRPESPRTAMTAG